jgi:hypothetical protein
MLVSNHRNLCKNFINTCSVNEVGDFTTPCAEAGIGPEGIIFRVDVPNGTYRFVAAVGDCDNVHAHRILAENGGEGPPEEIGEDYVVLVSNHDQAQYAKGETRAHSRKVAGDWGLK